MKDVNTVGRDDIKEIVILEEKKRSIGEAVVVVNTFKNAVLICKEKVSIRLKVVITVFSATVN